MAASAVEAAPVAFMKTSDGCWSLPPPTGPMMLTPMPFSCAYSMIGSLRRSSRLYWTMRNSMAPSAISIIFWMFCGVSWLETPMWRMSPSSRALSAWSSGPPGPLPMTRKVTSDWSWQI